MSLDWAGIDHVTKVDPAKSLPDDLGILGETDLVLAGGSDDVTEANTLETIERITSAHPDLPVLQEPYSGSHVTSETVDAADHLAIPAVFNGDRSNFVSKHVEFFAEAAQKPEQVTGASIPLVGNVIESRGRDAVKDLSEQVLAEGYVVQNVDSKAATESGVDRAFTPEEVAGAALATESFYDFPIFYVEYSGTYGGPEDVAAAATYLEETALVYGGGITTNEQTHEILDAGADAVVVGDCFHEAPAQFRDTIP
jgi:phosphoglycerol geranylgeranyltransferase